MLNAFNKYNTNYTIKFLRSIGRHKKSKVYTCEVCSKQIKTSLYNLRLHMYTHTGEKRMLNDLNEHLNILSTIIDKFIVKIFLFFYLQHSNVRIAIEDILKMQI